MTALPVASDRFAPVGLNTYLDHRPFTVDYAPLEAAVERARGFWAAGAPGTAEVESTELAAVAEWRPLGSRGLMRRVAHPVNRRVAVSERGRAAFVELRGTDELGSAHEVLAEAYGVGAGDVAPRRSILLPGPVHLRTWALFHDASVLSCAMTACIGDIVVVCGLATLPACHGRGHATHMMHALHRLYERTGSAADFVLSASESTRNLFARLGYHPIDPIASATGSAGNLVHQPAAGHWVFAPPGSVPRHPMAGG